jgi:GT2 family glycosyltransferase
MKEDVKAAIKIINDKSLNTLDEQLSIVIAVYDSLSYTKDCIASLMQNAPLAEIIVVNNGSKKDTFEYLKSLNNIKVIHWKKNLGVSKAWNAGLKLATRKVLCVLNNDVLVYQNGMQKLVDAALVHGIAGAEGACMNMDYSYAYSTHNESESDYLGGYCLVYRRDVWEKVGEFDELFSPAYWEDNDWCLRAKIAGYKWKIISGCVFHYVARTSGRVMDMNSLFETQKIKFINKWNKEFNGLGERILLKNNNNTEELQDCINQLRSRKPMCKIQVLTNLNTSSLSGYDAIGPEKQFKHYTQEIDCSDYLNKPLISFITWVNDEIKYRSFLKSSHNVKAEYIRLGQECESLSQAYNVGTELANGKYFAYVHQDVEILDSFFEQKIKQLFESRKDLGFVGVIGSLSNNNAKSLWFHEGYHSCRGFAIQNKFQAINNTIYNGPAKLIDGLLMITDKKFNFPESLPLVHFLDAWMCNLASDLGLQNWITDILVNHNSSGETQSESFKNNLTRYRLKWFGFADFSQTTNSNFNELNSFIHSISNDKKIGIAIKTRNRPEMLDACLTHFKEFTDETILKHIVIYDDASNLELSEKNRNVIIKHGFSENYYYSNQQVGIAQAQNSCLYLLGNCFDYYFLFDDDTFPIKNGWIDLYVKASIESGFEHLLYGNNVYCSILGEAESIEFYNQGFGVMLFFTKNMYQTLGGFCTEYGLYGTEHTDYTLRAQKANMTSPKFPYAGPINCSDYIWNVETQIQSQKTLIPIPISEESMSRPDKNKNILISAVHDRTRIDRPIYYPIKINHKILRLNSE